MREAFTYMFKDNCFWKKAGVFFLLSILTSFLMGYGDSCNNTGGCPLSQAPQVEPVTDLFSIGLNLLGLFFGALLCGYYFNIIEAISKQEKNIVLPFFNFGSCLVKGFKFTIASILLFLVLILVGAIFIFLLNKSPFWGIIVETVLLVVCSIFFAIISMGVIWNYANTNQILSIFAWKKVFNLIKANKVSYYSALGFCVLTAIAAMIVTTILVIISVFMIDSATIASIVFLVIATIIASYTAFVYMYLIAKSIKQIEAEE